MTLLWLVAGASLLVALIALNQARRTAKRLEQLSQNYWELKYQNGELRVQLQQLTGQSIELRLPPTFPGALNHRNHLCERSQSLGRSAGRQIAFCQTARKIWRVDTCPGLAPAGEAVS